MPALLQLGNSIISGGLGVEFLQPYLDISGKLCVSSTCISSSSSVQVSGRTCQRSTQTFDSGGTILDGGSLASHSSQHVGRHSLALSLHKISHHRCFGRACAQGSMISTFNPMAAQRCVLCRQRFSSSVSQWQGQHKCLCQRSTSSVRRNGQVKCLKGCTKQCHICPYIT